MKKPLQATTPRLLLILYLPSFLGLFHTSSFPFLEDVWASFLTTHSSLFVLLLFCRTLPLPQGLWFQDFCPKNSDSSWECCRSRSISKALLSMSQGGILQVISNRLGTASRPNQLSSHTHLFLYSFLHLMILASLQFHQETYFWLFSHSHQCPSHHFISWLSDLFPLHSSSL